MILAITGGTGSLGQAIIRNQSLLTRFGITRLFCISRDEQKQDLLEKNYEGDIPLDCFLGDVCDENRMLFALQDADFLIHTAALKIVPRVEHDIPTALKTNVLGTLNVCQAFLKSKNAKSMILASTDKACEPLNAYGIQKLLAERVVLWHNSFQNRITYGVTRYGNVFGSRGSVVEHWTRCALKKKPLPLTHPEMSRFFIDLEFAARFVLYSLMGGTTHVKAPKLKSTVMASLAKVVWKRHNPDVDCPIEMIGIRPGEKLHEKMKEEWPDSHHAEPFTDRELEEIYGIWYQNRFSG